VIGNPTSRDHNKAAVLEVVLSRAPLTRNELIELTGLSKATVSRAVEELRADGFVIDGGMDDVAGRGRRSTYLDVPATTGHVVGISFGAQTTCVLVADLRGREVQRLVLPTVVHEEVGKAATWLVDLMTDTRGSAQGPLRQVVVAVPGRVRAGTEIFGPAETMKTFAGSGLHRALADLVEAPVLLDSDANASLLGILADDTTLGNAVLFSFSSILNFAGCAEHELVRGRTPAFGDVGVLVSGVGTETLDGLLSTGGLLRFARGHGLDLERIEDLWLHPHDAVARAEVLEAFTTAIVSAVSGVVVTLDPESVHVVGRLQPLVEEVLPEVRGRLDDILTTAPVVKVPTQVLGLSVARGAMLACLDLTRARLRDAVLEARRQGRQEAQSVPAF
jgi:predicted NBD/HSP70 family sugar kinase/biotin operon repressor